MSHVTCQVSPVTCHMSHITCHTSCITCHVPHVTYIYIYFFSGQNCEASRWMVCYQKGLPCLVFNLQLMVILRLSTPFLIHYLIESLREDIQKQKHFSLGWMVKKLLSSTITVLPISRNQNAWPVSCSVLHLANFFKHRDFTILKTRAK